MKNKDYYSILEIGRNASIEEIKSSYRRLAMDLHPDTNPDIDSSLFLEVKEAYECLSDKDKRRNYDELLNPKMTLRKGWGSKIPMRGYNIFTSTEFSLSDIVKNVVKKVYFIDNGFQKEIDINIPRGLSGNNGTLLLKYAGQDGFNNGPKGDLVINFSIKEEGGFSLSGFDIYKDKTISFYDAIFGSSFDLKYLNEEVIKISIPKGINSGSLLKVQGYGIYKNDIEKGDLFIRILIHTPKEIKEEKDILDNLNLLKEIPSGY